MGPRNEMEKEEDYLVGQVNSGAMTQDEFDREMREMYAAYRAESEESAMRAYDDEMQRW